MVRKIAGTPCAGWDWRYGGASIASLARPGNRLPVTRGVPPASMIGVFFMIGPNDLPADYRPDSVSDGSLKMLDFLAVIAICVMTLGPLAFTAYKNPYTGAITATPNLPGK
jgi:hypothetical protein